MKKHSTGALSVERHQMQDQRYLEKHAYDFVIIGMGMSALTVGALLANAGYRVCMLEAHDVPGGYAHTFEMNSFHFCAQVHYIWGCAPGQRIYEFLKHIGLEQEIAFNSFDPEGYDRIVLPDQKQVAVPYGFDKLIENISQAYPDQREPLKRFVKILNTVNTEMSALPDGKVAWWRYLTEGYRFFHLLKYKNRTLQDLFDECQLSREAQAILSANSGDFGAPPNQLSVFPYTALLSGYNTGAYYPEKHYLFMINRIAHFIAESPGCHLYFETEVTGFEKEGQEITGVLTTDGKGFQADRIICNMDPKKATHMIGLQQTDLRMRGPLDYQYSPAFFNIYLGLKDIDLKNFGFGNYNIWHLDQWDLNKTWKEMLEHNHQHPLIFLSTPNFHTHNREGTPDGCEILEVVTVANFHQFSSVDPAKYRQMKRDLATRMVNLVEEKYIPELQKHIMLKVVGSPTTSADFCSSPFGNAYGSHMSPKNMGLDRLKAQSPWSNLFWCNASSGYAGIYGTTFTGMQLYMDLTEDRFFPPQEQLSDAEAIAYARSRCPTSLATR